MFSWKFLCPKIDLEVGFVDNSGIEHIGGDMFVNVPKADAIFMKVCILVLF